MGGEFVPLTLETHGPMGKPLSSCWEMLGLRLRSVGQGHFTRQQFVKEVLQEPCGSLPRFNALLEGE